MKSQEKAIVNYNTLLKALTRYQGIDGYSKGAAKQFAKNLNAEIKSFRDIKPYIGFVLATNDYALSIHIANNVLT